MYSLLTRTVISCDSHPLLTGLQVKLLSRLKAVYLVLAILFIGNYNATLPRFLVAKKAG